jgi:hypothetical protein
MPDFKITTTSNTDKGMSVVTKEVNSSSSHNVDSLHKVEDENFRIHGDSGFSRGTSPTINVEEWGQKLWEDTVARVTQHTENSYPRLENPGNSGHSK